MDPNAFDFSGLNWLGLCLAVVANIVIGFIWYAKWMPTGRIWMREMKMPLDMQPNPGQMAKGLVLMVIGSFLLMFLLAHTFWVYQDAFRNTATGGMANFKLRVMDGVTGAAFIWLGFFVPQQWSAVAWENKSWSFFFINTGYSLVSLIVAAILLVTVGTTG